MKVLQVINNLATGGAEKLLIESLPLYRKMEIDMDILVLNGFDYPFMKSLRELNCCRIFSLGSLSVYSPINVLKIIPFLRRYDIVHVHVFPSMYWVALAKLISFSNSKLIFTEHNTYNRRMGNRLFKRFDRLVYSLYERVVCITPAVEKVLSSYMPKSRSKFIVIENGVDLEKIEATYPIKREEIDSRLSYDDFLIIQVSGFRPQKDQVTLIKAVKVLPHKVKLLLIGTGTNLVNCEALVHELGLAERVFFLGERTDVISISKTVDVCVLSSHWEGFGLVAVEGMACRKPVIASNVPGLSNIVSGAGLLFSVGNEEQLVSQIRSLLDNGSHYEMVAHACKNRSHNYSITQCIRRHIDLYDELYEA